MNFHQHEIWNNTPATHALNQIHNLSLTDHLKHRDNSMKGCKFISKLPRRNRRKRGFGIEELLETLPSIEDSMSFPSFICEFDDRSRNVKSKIHSYSCLERVKNEKVSVTHPPDCSEELFHTNHHQQRGLIRSKSIKLSLVSLATDITFPMNGELDKEEN
jgi:hypothetical protein